MSRTQGESLIRNVIYDLVQRCASGGEEVTETLAAFMIKAVVLDPKNGFDMERTCSSQDIQRLTQICLQKLTETSSPFLDTIKMQVHFDLNYTTRREFLEEISNVLEASLSSLTREITDTRVTTRDQVEGLYSRITHYMVLRSGLGCTSDPDALQPTTAALQSVFPQTELGSFMALLKREKEEQLKDLCLLVTGVLLFHRSSTTKDQDELQDLMPQVLREVLPLSRPTLDQELQDCEGRVWRLTSALEALTDPGALTEALTDPGALTEALTEALTDPGALTEAFTDPGALTEALTDPGALTEALTDPGALTEALTDPGVLTEALTDPGALTEALTDPGVLTEALTDPGALTEALTEALTDPGVLTEALTDPGALTEALTEALTDPGVLTEALTDPEAPTSQSQVSVELLRQALYNVRQHQAFINILLADVAASVQRVALFQDELRTQLRLLWDTMRNRKAIAAAQVFPIFRSVSGLWRSLQDEAELLQVFRNLVLRLRDFVASQAEIFSDERLEDLLQGSQIKSDAERRRLGDEKPIEPAEVRGPDTEWLVPEDPRVSASLQGVQLSGFCGHTLVCRDGLLLPGNPQLGLLKHKEKLYAFSSRDAALLFASDPELYISEVAERAKLCPELIQLLSLHQQFTCLSPHAQLQSGEQLLVRPTTWSCSGSQTDTHPVESFIDPNYEWNEWEMRRKALKLTNLRTKLTHSTQTNTSYLRRESSTQTFPPKDAVGQTSVDGESSVPRTEVFLSGLRGQRNGSVVRVELTRAEDE